MTTPKAIRAEEVLRRSFAHVRGQQVSGMHLGPVAIGPRLTSDSTVSIYFQGGFLLVMEPRESSFNFYFYGPEVGDVPSKPALN